MARDIRDESWEYSNVSDESKKTYPILRSYLIYTFGRLMNEGKVLINNEIEINDVKGLAAYHTGLFDKHYQSIFAVFIKNSKSTVRDGKPVMPWKLEKFCLAASGFYGKKMVEAFPQLPQRAHYFNDPAHVIYDTRKGNPIVNYEHVIIDNIDRYPQAFLEDELTGKIEFKDIHNFDEDGKKDFFEKIRTLLKQDERTYKRILARVKSAIDLAMTKLQWNFNTAIPSYYPPKKNIALLLPLCLVDDEKVDMALVVERTENGQYLGHTILQLHLAYSNARLVCRPDSYWLNPQKIEATEDEFIDDLIHDYVE
jgi:hypothetical protein